MTTELTTLERRLAEREARCAIESYCQRVTSSGWYNTAMCDPDTTEEVAEAVRYLELRGLLERQDDAPQTVRVTVGDLGMTEIPTQQEITTV